METKNLALPYIFPCSLKPSAAFLVIVVLAFAMLPGGYASEERYSMQIQNKTLAAVFQELTRMSGRPIAFDKQWANQPINIRFANLSLEMAIAKILKNLNHVVIFEEDKIQIKIYSIVKPGEDIDRASADPQYPQERLVPDEITPPGTPFPINSGQEDTREGESASEEGDDPETSDEDAENSEEAEDTEQTEDVEDTKEEKTAGESEEADENETISPESG